MRARWNSHRALMLFNYAVSDVIHDGLHPPLSGTVRAAEKRPLRLYAVTHNLASAVVAYRRQLMDGTFEAVEGMGLTGGDDLKREIVVVAADFAASH